MKGKRYVAPIILCLAIVILGGVMASCGNSKTENAVVNSGNAAPQERTTLKIGVTPGPHEQIAEKVKEIVAKDGLKLEIVVFSDGTQINKALAEKQIDANAFQHGPYFDKFKTDHNLDGILVKIADTYTIPMGIYSKKLKKVSEIPNGATLAVPGDPSNTARALMLFEKAGLIRLNSNAGVNATVRDIAENPKKLIIKEMDVGMIPPVLGDLDAAAINTNYAMLHGLSPVNDSIFMEEKNGPWICLLAVRAAEKDDPVFAKLVKAYHSPELKQFIDEKFAGSIIAGW